MTTPNETAPVANLRETRRELAAAKRRHPAGSKPAPKKAAAKAAGQKLKWQYDRETKMQTGQTAVVGDRTYAIKPAAEGKWQGTVTVGKTETVLVTGSFGAAYNACVKHNRGVAA